MNIVTKLTHVDELILEANSNVIGRCDDCAKVISVSDQYLKLPDSIFCEEHVCMLSEAIEEFQISIDQGYVMEFYSSLDAQKTALLEMYLEMETTGDRKFITIA